MSLLSLHFHLSLMHFLAYNIEYLVWNLIATANKNVSEWIDDLATQRLLRVCVYARVYDYVCSFVCLMLSTCRLFMRLSDDLCLPTATIILLNFIKVKNKYFICRKRYLFIYLFICLVDRQEHHAPVCHVYFWKNKKKKIPKNTEISSYKHCIYTLRRSSIFDIFICSIVRKSFVHTMYENFCYVKILKIAKKAKMKALEKKKKIIKIYFYISHAMRTTVSVEHVPVWRHSQQ